MRSRNLLTYLLKHVNYGLIRRRHRTVLCWSTRDDVTVERTHTRIDVQKARGRVPSIDALLASYMSHSMPHVPSPPLSLRPQHSCRSCVRMHVHLLSVIIPIHSASSSRQYRKHSTAHNTDPAITRVNCSLRGSTRSFSGTY